MALPSQPAATRDSAPSGSSSLLRELFEVVVLAVILYFGISFAVQTVHVEGLSMFATLDNNDYLELRVEVTWGASMRLAYDTTTYAAGLVLPVVSGG